MITLVLSKEINQVFWQMSRRILPRKPLMSRATRGMVEPLKRSVSINQTLDGIRSWPGLTTVIRVESERQLLRHYEIEVESETRYYVSSLSATAKEFSERIR